MYHIPELNTHVLYTFRTAGAWGWVGYVCYIHFALLVLEVGNEYGGDNNKGLMLHNASSGKQADTKDTCLFGCVSEIDLLIGALQLLEHRVSKITIPLTCQTLLHQL